MYSLCPKWQAVDEIIIIGYNSNGAAAAIMLADVKQSSSY